MPALTEKSARRVQRQILRAEGGEFNNPPKRTKRRIGKNSTPRVVMLLEDLESGGRAEAAVLVETVSSESQIVEICGRPQSGTFRLDFSGEETSDLAYDISAADLKTALVALPGLSAGDLEVEFGPRANVGGTAIYRWLIHFTGQYESVDVPELIPKSVSITGLGVTTLYPLEVEVRSQPDLEDTGDRIRVLCAVPLPSNVRIYAGSIAVAIPIPSFGYCLTAVECRDCEGY